MINPVILVAIIFQAIISKVSRIVGSIVGYIITTGILIWGLSLYAEGNAIAFFGVVLSQPVFIFACLVWYGFDTYEFLKARKAKAIIKSGLLEDTNVAKFYNNTLKAWNDGKLAELNKSFEIEGKMAYEDFTKAYIPVEEGALDVLFTQFPPKEDEFLIGYGNSDSFSDRGWFTLTNMRLILKDGVSKSYEGLNLADIDDFEIKGAGKKITFKMKSGKELEFNNLKIYPDKKYLRFAMQMQKTSSEGD
ncbi:MAG: hypothetical protein GTO17_02265 [Candidatus Aminicenantes bacterium]|nr:hypothetical protein [Candidatus Aminicenantes bacterium]